MMVLPSCASSCNVFMRATAEVLSRPDVGSSHMMSLGSVSSSVPMFVRFFSPPAVRCGKPCGCVCIGVAFTARFTGTSRQTDTETDVRTHVCTRGPGVPERTGYEHNRSVCTLGKPELRDNSLDFQLFLRGRHGLGEPQHGGEVQLITHGQVVVEEVLLLAVCDLALVRLCVCVGEGRAVQ